jgi:hypothetical protein
MMSKFPKWFWFSIVIFILISWLFSCVTHFSSEFIIVNFDWYVGYALFYFGLLTYPAFLVVMLVSLYKKIELDSNEKVWAFIFLLIPLATNLPILHPLIVLT